MVPSWGSSTQADDRSWLARTTHTCLLPQKATVMVKPMAEKQNSQRVEMTRESQPEMGITMISAIK